MAAAAFATLLSGCGGSGTAHAGAPAATTAPAPVEPAPATPSAQDRIDALPEPTRTDAEACETALVPEIAVAEGGGTVITPRPCTILSTPIYQAATIAAELRWSQQRTAAPTPTPTAGPSSMPTVR